MKNISAFLILMAICLLTLNCKSQSVSVKSEVNPSVVYPFSDPNNSGNWALNKEVSDEFDAATIDEDKWYIVGKFENGKPVYKDPDYPNRNVWKGRAPSQFSGRNYRLEGGKLILETRWEPDFPFADDNKQTWGKDNKIEKFANLTTACFIGRREFKYGYMEIKSKAADAEITSAFWATGSQTELDIFEQFGDHRQKGKEWMDRELWWSIHDWSKEGKGKSVYTEHLDYGFRVADDFHVFGCEWDKDFLKFYADGKLIKEVTRLEAGDGWVVVNPLKLWVNSVTWSWHGLPVQSDLPSSFQIDYIRVWQK